MRLGQGGARGHRRLTLLALALSAFSMQPAFGAEFLVDVLIDGVDANPGDGVCATVAGECTLRAAVLEANALAGPDRILLGPGTHLITIPGAFEDDGLTGDLDVLGDLLISGAGRDLTQLSGTTESGILQASFGRLTITDLTFQESGSDRFWSGGPLLIDVRADLRRVAVRGCDGWAAITAFQSVVSLRELLVEDNPTGGMRVVDTVVTIRDSVFQRNAAVSAGGGGREHVFLDEGSLGIVSRSSFQDGDEFCTGLRSYFGDLVATDTEFARNPRGGLDLLGRSRLRRCRVIDNTAVTGGVPAGIYAGGLLLLSDSLVARNATSSGVGGVQLSAFVAPPPERVLLRSTIRDNAGTTGGLLMAAQLPTRIDGCTITGNQATRSGGGVSAWGEGMRIVSSTIAGNTAAEGGGGLRHVGAPGGALTLSNSVISGNTTGGQGPDCIGSIELRGPNLIEQEADCDLTGDVVDLITGLVPSLAPVGDFGGPTPTRPPLPGSPAIDAGSDLLPGSDPSACSTSGQRGVVRPQGLRCDLGAVEICADPAGLDTDGDGIQDACDACPFVADDQHDQDRDGLGDACDPECGDEPSALDRAPLVTPLRVMRNPEHWVSQWFPDDHLGWLTLSWEGEEFESEHELVMGSLAALREGRYDHVGFGACGLPGGEVDLLSPREDSYFLVVGRCGATLSSAGRDSAGRERPEPLDACR